ncbi:unnamed protein product [Rotaria sp. Silwood1]|nr:unnamed protein product [Rotaria sp. Silwood1]CAF4618585.1 unnamed protein product [Rotaria sp. Silwood1]
MYEGIVWQERGPAYDSVDGGNERGNTGNEAYTAGRVNSVLIDAADATGNTVFCGSVTGGIWKCTNFLSTQPNWQPVNDFLSNMSVSSICQNPANLNVMYMATGEPWNNQGALNGSGVFKSIDHGITWTQLASTTSYTKSFEILCDATGNVYYATTNGLLRSTDGGVNWITITPTGTNVNCTDIEISSTGRLHAAFGFFGTTVYHRYTNNPATVTTSSWTASVGIRKSATASMRMVLASKGNTLYALTCNSSREVDSCYKSTDGGATWTLKNTSGYTDNVTNGQGWVNLTLSINPDNDNEILMGGLDAFKSTDGGATINRISNWVLVSPYVHADHHYMKWWKVGANRKLLIAGDGGIFYSTDDGGSFVNANDYDSYNKKFFANNGTGSILKWENPTTGDSSIELTFTAMSGKTPTAFTVSPYSQVGAGKTKLFIGTTGGGLFVLNNADTVKATSANAKLVSIGTNSFPNGTIRCVAVGTTENNLAVVFSNYGVSNVWVTNNGGTSWTAIDGNLPDMPVRWALFHPTSNTKLILGTETGVFVTGLVNGSSTVWSPSPEFPTVRTSMLKLRKSDNTVLAATYGRGLWTGNILSILPAKKIELSGILLSNDVASLNWKTIGSNDKIKFGIEFSSDGVNFLQIAKLPSGSKTFNHKLDIEKGFYRIVGFELNTSPIYSNTVLIKSNKNESSLQIVIAPNPVKVNGRVILQSNANGVCNWAITNTQGVVLQKGKELLQANTEKNINKNISKLSSGYYIIAAEQNGIKKSTSFIKE